MSAACVGPANAAGFVSNACCAWRLSSVAGCFSSAVYALQSQKATGYAWPLSRLELMTASDFADDAAG